MTVWATSAVWPMAVILNGVESPVDFNDSELLRYYLVFTPHWTCYRYAFWNLCFIIFFLDSIAYNSINVSMFAVYEIYWELCNSISIKSVQTQMLSAAEKNLVIFLPACKTVFVITSWGTSLCYYHVLISLTCISWSICNGISERCEFWRNKIS